MAAVRAASGSSARIDSGRGLAVRGGRAEDLHGHLHGLVELGLPLVLEHHADERRGLVAGTSAGAAQHGLGQLVQAELVHLAGQGDLRLGVQPQAEEPLGGLAGAVDVARADGDPQRHLFATLQAEVVERLDRVDQSQGFGGLALLLQELGQVEPEVGFRPRRLDDLGQLGDRLVFLLVPPEDRAERQPGIDRVAGDRAAATWAR